MILFVSPDGQNFCKKNKAPDFLILHFVELNCIIFGYFVTA